MLTPSEMHSKLKKQEPNIGMDMEYKGAEPHVNIYNTHMDGKQPLLVFHYVNVDSDGDGIVDTVQYQHEFELYNFTDMWMCRALDTTLPIIYHMEYYDFCFKVNDMVIGGETYSCAHTETFTPTDDDSIYEALDNCRVYALEQFHLLSHKMDRFMQCHHEFEEIIKESDRITLRQLFHIISHFEG